MPDLTLGLGKAAADLIGQQLTDLLMIGRYASVINFDIGMKSLTHFARTG